MAYKTMIDCMGEALEKYIEDNGIYGQKEVLNMADSITAKYDLTEHLQNLETYTTTEDVVEACEKYIDDVKERLRTEKIRCDRLAKYLGVEVEDD